MRRSALRGAAAEHVGDHRAQNAERVDAVVRIKAAILDGDKSFRHVVRQFAQRHCRAAHVAARGKRRAVTPTIRTEGGRFGISSDWIGGSRMPTQTSAPIPAMTAHSASTVTQ